MTASSTGLQSVTTHSPLVLKGALAVQRGVVMLQTFGKAADISNVVDVDTYDPVTKKGYQRERQGARVRKAADYYRDGGRMPNGLLVNIRETDMANIEIKILGDSDGYKSAIEDGGDWIGVAEVIIASGVTIWVYDGQHREGAIEELLSGDSEFDDFPVPLSVTIGLDTPEEMKEFYEVNNNAKAVKTDLAWELLRIMAEDDPALAELLEIKGQDWKTRGADIVDQLVASGGLWADTIQEPNVRKVRNDRLTLNKAQFIRSLQPVLAMPAFAKADAGTIGKVLDAYWEGIATVLPAPFDPGHEPKKWVLQKGPGAIAFHRVLPQVIEVLRAKGERLADPKAYADVLADLPTLSGEVVDEDGTPRTVTGADFWLAGPEGVASQWTGDAGRKRLAIRVQAVLPKPSEVLNL